MARVLIGVDGSELAARAARQAIQLLGTHHDVTVVEVVRPMAPVVTIPSGAIAGAAVVDDELIEESHQLMTREAETHVAATVRDLGMSATTRVVTGDAGVELCRLAADGAFDVLVVGSHGSGFLKRVLLGSVSHHVLNHAPCAVLVVREADDAAPGEQPASVHGE
jgi:nucleotide-binding universal stress UspA family protein